MTDAQQKVESQIEKFRAKARELECDESEEAFERKLKKVVKYKDEKQAWKQKSAMNAKAHILPIYQQWRSFAPNAHMSFMGIRIANTISKMEDAQIVIGMVLYQTSFNIAASSAVNNLGVSTTYTAKFKKQSVLLS